MTFRKEEFEIFQHYYVCADSGGKFSTEALLGLNQLQLHNKFRERHALPLSGEIAKIRYNYGLSASKMAEVLGFGINVYRNYENGEVPSISNARLIQMCRYPENFLRLVRINGVLKETEQQKLTLRIEELLQKHSSDNYQMGLSLLASSSPGMGNGFVYPDQQVVLQLIRHLTQPGPLKMKWLPLFFFLIDFSCFRLYGKGISGLFYQIENNMITIKNFLGIIHWAESMGYCKGWVNQEGQALIVPADGIKGNGNQEQLHIADLFDRITKNLSNIQRQKELAELAAELMDYSVIRSNADGLSNIPYELAFELNFLDELAIFE